MSDSGSRDNYRLLSLQNTPKASRELLHRALRFICTHVYDLGGFEDGLFQHVCGNSEPVSAV
jgi:hypothetical protein